MGTRYEVISWLTGQPGGCGPERYGDVQVWCGQSLVVAIWETIKARRKSSCVRLVLR
jgi:hypothetical protein